MSSPRRIATEIRMAFISEDTCPECLGELDTGKECNTCNYDAMEEIYEYHEIQRRVEEAPHNQRNKIT